jgi:hypothetical protein
MRENRWVRAHPQRSGGRWLGPGGTLPHRIGCGFRREVALHVGCVWPVDLVLGSASLRYSSGLRYGSGTAGGTVQANRLAGQDGRMAGWQDGRMAGETASLGSKCGGFSAGSL